MFCEDLLSCAESKAMKMLNEKNKVHWKKIVLRQVFFKLFQMTLAFFFFFVLQIPLLK